MYLTVFEARVASSSCDLSAWNWLFGIEGVKLLPGATHFYIGLGSGGQVFIPTLCFGDGSRGGVLLVSEVPLLFELENIGIVIVDRAGAVLSLQS